MGDRTSYPPGTFSWAELVTTDAGSAKGFYSALLGWEYDDQPVGDDQVYSMVTRDGKFVAALYADPDQPTTWNSYVTVASVDAATARAADAGGTVVHDPFDVMEVGRMAVVADPAGAPLFLWEPRLHIGAQLVNAVGALTWNELLTTDVETAKRFYGELFGWTFEEMPGSGGYHVISNGGRINGGISPVEDVTAWMPYFGHDDVGSAIEAIPDLGGTVMHGPIAMPQGQIVVAADPQGAGFALWSGEYDD